MSSLSLASFILWLASVNFWGHAPLWVAIQELVPGGSAIRAPLRIDLVLNIAVVIVAMFGFETSIRAMMARNSARAGAVGALLAVALIGEQLNSMPTHLIDRSVESRSFSRVSTPPSACTSFFISSETAGPLGWLTTQTDAMLASEQFGIPTMNGYSSWFPTGWDLMTPGANVAVGVADWAERHGVTNGICALDLSWGQWFALDTNRLRALSPIGELSGKAIANGDFETGNVAPWEASQDVHGGLETGQVHGGAYSLAETAGVGSFYQDAAGLDSGQTYWVAAWVRSSVGATASAQIATYDPGSAVATFSESLVPGPGWHLLLHSMAVGSAGAFRVHLFRNRGTGTIYWDDVGIYSSAGRGDGVANGAFEDVTPSPWLPMRELQGGVTAAQAHSGRQSLAETAGAASAYQDVSGLEPGRRYTVSAWTLASAQATATAQIAVFDPGANVATFSQPIGSSGSWRLLTHSVTVSSQGVLRIHLFRNKGSGTVYWDDVRLSRAAP
jgi:hypothetical protein